MGKTVEVNLSISTLRNDAFRVANIQSTLGGFSDLSATFSRKSLSYLCKKNDCDSLRIYPAAYNNELIMIAFGTDGKNDLVESNHFCLVSNEQGAVSVNETVLTNGVELLPANHAKGYIEGAGSGAATVEKLREIPPVEDNAEKRFKVLFDESFFAEKEDEADEILFEVVDMMFNDSPDAKRTMVAHAQKNNGDVVSSVSLLPCPPNCGGTYGNEDKP
jgi:hypothetical protein